MIQKTKSTGKWRARYDYGYNKYYKSLIREHKKLLRKANTLKDSKKSVPKSLKNAIINVEYNITDAENRFGNGEPVNIKTRRSFSSRHKWQAEYAEKLFAAAHEYESVGDTVPRLLEKEIESLREAPDRFDYLEEVSYQFAAISGFNENVLTNADYSLFLEQSDTNTQWIDEFEISSDEVRDLAFGFCNSKNNLQLKNKTYIFTGSFVGFTTCEDYVKCLETLALKNKVDGIITAGPWIKYIFLHKTSTSQKVLDSVKKLAKKVKVYAVRSNKEDTELIPQLKELGIEFVNGIEDEKNLFVNYQFGRVSTKDQLTKYRDWDVEKNIYTPTTYVACEPRVKYDRNWYLIGSGSSSFHTPSARIWANSYDSQSIAADKYDQIGGHILRFDNESEVYPSAFYYNEDTKSIFNNGKAYSSSACKDGRIHLLVSDGHFASVHKYGYAALKDFIVKNRSRIDTLVLNGDIFSNEVLCHHNDDNFAEQFKVLLEQKSFLHEVAKTREMIHELVNLTTNNGRRKIRLIYKLGNHETNSFKKLSKKSIVHFLMQMLDLDRLLELSDVGFEVIKSTEPYKVGDVPLLHGHELNRLHAQRVLGRKCTIGHSHRGMIDNLGVILPTLEDQKHCGYFGFYMAPWSVGWGIITEYKGYTEKPEICALHNNKYFDFKKLVSINKPAEIKIPKKITLTYWLD